MVEETLVAGARPDGHRGVRGPRGRSARHRPWGCRIEFRGVRANPHQR